MRLQFWTRRKHPTSGAVWYTPVTPRERGGVAAVSAKKWSGDEMVLGRRFPEGLSELGEAGMRVVFREAEEEEQENRGDAMRSIPEAQQTRIGWLFASRMSSSASLTNSSERGFQVGSANQESAQRALHEKKELRGWRCGYRGIL